MPSTLSRRGIERKEHLGPTSYGFQKYWDSHAPAKTWLLNCTKFSPDREYERLNCLNGLLVAFDSMKHNDRATDG